MGISPEISRIIRWRGRGSGEQLEDLGAVALELGPAHPGDRQQLALGGGLVLGDELERGVSEDDVGRHLFLVGPVAAPLAQPLEESLVVGGRALGTPADLLLRGAGEGLAALAAVAG